MPLPRTMLDAKPPSDANLEIVQGSWPEDISGEFFLSSPDPNFKGKHAFFADGVLYRLSLRKGTFGAGPHQLAWRHAVIETPSQRLHARCPDVWNITSYGYMSKLGYLNAANTAQVPWGDRLFVTWDAGRPVEVDPVSMKFLGELGTRESWKENQPLPILPMIPTPAHPVVDPDRNCLWTCTYNPMTQRIAVVRCDPDGREVKRWTLKDAKLPQSSHTISQTRDWIVIVDNGYKIDLKEMHTGERTVATNTKEPVFLIRKDTLDKLPSGELVEPKTFHIGPECMHYYADYEDSDGKVRVFFEHSTDSDIAIGMREGDRDFHGNLVDPRLAGMYGLALSAPTVTMLEFDPETGEVSERARYGDPERFWNVQTSASDWSRQGLTRPTLHHVMYNGWKPEGISQRQLGIYGGRVDLSKVPQQEQPARLASFDWRNDLKPKSDHAFGIDDWATSPTFVPRNAGAGEDAYTGSDPGGHDGYVIVAVLNDAGFRIECFDASNVGKGPVATAAAPGYVMPFVIHSSWMPSSTGAPSVDRLRFRDDFSDKQLASIPDELQTAVKDVAREIDEELDAIS